MLSIKTAVRSHWALLKSSHSTAYTYTWLHVRVLALRAVATSLDFVHSRCRNSSSARATGDSKTHRHSSQALTYPWTIALCGTEILKIVQQGGRTGLLRTNHDGSGVGNLANVLVCLHYLLYTSCQRVSFPTHFAAQLKSKCCLLTRQVGD